MNMKSREFVKVSDMTHDHHDHHDETCGSRRHSRRVFLKGASATSLALLGGACGLPDLAFGQTAGKKTLVKILMRGGADGLSVMPKYGDPNVPLLRPNLFVPSPDSSNPNAALKLDNMYGLNPNLRPLMEIWESGRMAFVPGVHFSEGNRSHFDCQQWIELGLSTTNQGDGVFNKYLQVVPGSDVLRAVRAGSPSVAQSLIGRDIIVPGIDNINNLGLSFTAWQGDSLTKVLAAIGDASVSGPPIEVEMRRSTRAMVDVIAKVQAAASTYKNEAGGLQYNDGENGRPARTLGMGLKVVAQLLKGGIPLEVAAIDWQGTWDTHSNQLGSSIIDRSNGHANGLAEGANDLLTFWRDIAAFRNDVVVMVGTEFGRTALQNGSKGTDHGRGGVWFAFGGPTKGGIFAPLPELTQSLVTDATNKNSIPITMNYKDMLAEAMIRHLGFPQAQLSTLFPGHTFTNFNMFTR